MTRSTPVPLFELPDGTGIQQANQHETDSLFKQIYVDNVYFRNGIALPENPLVIDGGANIGLFSLYVLQQHPTATVVAVEPAPKSFQLLRANTSQFATATAHNYALGREDGTMPFTFFPNVTCASGLYGAEDMERFENVVRTLALQNEKIPAVLRRPEGRKLLDGIIAERLTRETVLVPVRSLSTLIGETGIEHINLLKLDVEGKEYDALQGIRDEHWAMIDQLVLEVHDSPVTLPLLMELLRKRDFTATSESEGLQALARKAMIYARRAAGRA